jgi:hypothetical protein
MIQMYANTLLAMCDRMSGGDSDRNERGEQLAINVFLLCHLTNVCALIACVSPGLLRQLLEARSVAIVVILVLAWPWQAFVSRILQGRRGSLSEDGRREVGRRYLPVAMIYVITSLLLFLVQIFSGGGRS